MQAHASQAPRTPISSHTQQTWMEVSTGSVAKGAAPMDHLMLVMRGTLFLHTPHIVATPAAVKG